MKARKKKRDRPGEASSGHVEFHEVGCLGCGKLIRKVKKQKETVKHSFECPRCTCRFFADFPMYGCRFGCLAAWRGVSLKLDFINEVLKYHKEDIKREIEKYYTPN